jgi:signal transduction histidine kinase
MLGITYNLNRAIENDARILREIENPLEIMVEQVIGYDAILTGNAHEALLHLENNESFNLLEHKKKYDEIGAKLDNLLKVEAIMLLNKSLRSDQQRREIEYYLTKLDQINLLLVDLETRAFQAMEKGDYLTARSLIVSDQYTDYKNELSDLYNQWARVEAEVSEEYRLRILDNTRKVRFYNLELGLLFIIIAVITPFIIARPIIKAIKKLKEATEQIDHGDYKVNLDINTGDEIQDLANSFNQTSKQLDRIEEERKQIDKAKTEFLSITSHELRSPMTPMKAQLQMVLNDYFGKLNKEQRESLQIVLNNTERLDKIIVDFLEISRIEAARLKFNFIKADLGKTVNLVVDEMKNFMPEKNIKIETFIERLPIIECDPDRVSQVLRNLINNAIKFTRENGKIEVSAKPYGDMILFSVKDSGIGISEKDRRKLFEPFYQVDNMYQHKSGGTGLGLAICKGIVESQNGKIWLDSWPGKGSIFYFTIPLKPVREIKAIKILFSEAEKYDRLIEDLFKEYLGPLGEKEFEILRESKGLTSGSIRDYINDLLSKGIILKEKAEEFKNRIRLISGGKEDIKKSTQEVSNIDISKFVKGGEK